MIMDIFVIDFLLLNRLVIVTGLSFLQFLSKDKTDIHASCHLEIALNLLKECRKKRWEREARGKWKIRSGVARWR